jgi:hypothetical protein
MNSLSLTESKRRRYEEPKLEGPPHILEQGITTGGNIASLKGKVAVVTGASRGIGARHRGAARTRWSEPRRELHQEFRRSEESSGNNRQRDQRLSDLSPELQELMEDDIATSIPRSSVSEGVIGEIESTF